jgi:hypothetical protein
MADSLTIQQELLTDSQEVYVKLVDLIKQSKGEILVATAWFTDPDLFDLLLEKKREGLQIHVLVDDNEQNQKLNLNLLNEGTTTLTKVKVSGYGKMHQKSAVFDRKTVLIGSYNWSVNARSRNHENVIITNDPKIIEAQIKSFFNIKELINTDMDSSNSNPGPLAEVVPTPAPPQEQSFEKKFSAEVNDLIVAATAETNPAERMIEYGHQIARESNGDPETIYNTLDTLYANLIVDIQLSSTIKTNVIQRIQNLRQLYESDIKGKAIEDEAMAKTKINTEEEQLNVSIASKEKHVDEKRTEIKNIEQIKLKDLRDRFERVIANKRQLELDLRSKTTAWGDLAISYFLLVGLSIFAFIIYTSTAYLIFLGEKEAQVMQQGLTIGFPDTFALQKATEYGGIVGVIGIIAFVFLPFSLAFTSRIFKEDKTTGWIVTVLVGVIAVDGSLSYMIAKTAYNLLREQLHMGDPNWPAWEWTFIFKRKEFTISIICGTLSIVGLKFLVDYIFTLLESTKPTENTIRQNTQIRQIEEELEGIRVKISAEEQNINNLNTEINGVNKDIQLDKERKSKLSAHLAENLNRISARSRNELHSIEVISNKFLADLDNNRHKLSMTELRDRTANFIIGFDKFLYETYAQVRASALAQTAKKIKDEWLANNISRSNS